MGVTRKVILAQLRKWSAQRSRLNEQYAGKSRVYPAKDWFSDAADMIVKLDKDLKKAHADLEKAEAEIIRRGEEITLLHNENAMLITKVKLRFRKLL